MEAKCISFSYCFFHTIVAKSVGSYQHHLTFPLPSSPHLSNGAVSSGFARYSRNPSLLCRYTPVQALGKENKPTTAVVHSSFFNGGTGGNSGKKGTGGGGGYGGDSQSNYMNYYFLFLGFLLLFTNMDKDLVQGLLLAMITLTWQGITFEMTSFLKALAILLLLSRFDLDSSPQRRGIVLISVMALYALRGIGMF